MIGINTAIASPTGVFAGYGFAIPSNLASRVADQLVRFGEARRPFMGVLLDNVSAADAEVYGLATPEGAEIKFVEANGPADAAGLQLGDVVTAVDGRPVRTVSDLQAALAQLDPDSSVRVRIVRFGREEEASIRLGVVRSGVAPPAPQATASASIGFAPAEVRGGLVVAAVEPFSPALRAGVSPGQLIISLNRQEVQTVADLQRVLAASPSRVVSLIVEDPSVGRTIINYRR